MNLIYTLAGLDALAYAVGNDTPLNIAELALGTGQWTADNEATSLQSELKRLPLYGQRSAERLVHLTATDATAEEYTCYEAGIYLDDGTLFAIIADTTAVAAKVARTAVPFSIDLLHDQFENVTINIGDIGMMMPQATPTQLGAVLMATDEQALEGAPGVVPDCQQVLEMSGRPIYESLTKNIPLITMGAINSPSVTAISPLQAVICYSESGNCYLSLFDRSESGGQLGTPFSLGSHNIASVANIGGGRVAVLTYTTNSDTDVVITTRNISDWSVVGNPISVPKQGGFYALTPSATNEVILCLASRGFSVLSFDGSDWSEVAAESGLGLAEIAIPIGNDCLLAHDDGTLSIYQRDGSSYNKISGSELALSTSSPGGISMTRLNQTDVAIALVSVDDNGTDYDRVVIVRRTGDTLAFTGPRISQASPAFGGLTEIAALTGNTLLTFISNDTLQTIDIRTSNQLSPGL